MVMAQGPSYPLGADVTSLPAVERWRPLVNLALVIPHQIWLALLTFGSEVLAVLTWFSILFTGRMPERWSDYMTGVFRYQWRVNCYLYGWTNIYPSFTPPAGHIDPGDYPAVLYCARAVERDRVTVFFRAIMAIPQMVVLYFVGIAGFAALAVGWLAVLITGRWPEGLRRFAIGYLRWAVRLSAYMFLLCDEYPPFSLEP